MFSWNVGMVLHVLKSDPTLRDLEHVQVDETGMAYLFFFDKQGHRGLTLEAAQAMRAHVGEAFAEWISHSAHFTVNPIPPAEGWSCVMAASEQHRHWSQAEYPGQLVPNLASSKSDSTLSLVGSAPPSAMKFDPAEDTGSGWATRAPPTHLQGRPNWQRRMPKTHPHHLPSKEGQIQMDTPVSEAPGGRLCRRTWWN